MKDKERPKAARDEAPRREERRRGDGSDAARREDGQDEAPRMERAGSDAARPEEGEDEVSGVERSGSDAARPADGQDEAPGVEQAGSDAARREEHRSEERAQEAFERRLSLELKRMDEALPEKEADPQQMLALVREVQAAQRRRLLRDLARFWLAAAVLLAAGIWAAGAAPAYYVGAQLALTAAVLALVALAGLLRRPLESRRNEKAAGNGGGSV
ncbi:DUF5345 family protein [Paenibacillus pasadenensis]|uniref:Uncharacterized protein n=1 Tax=Paenibacillus pasadenensis TaxID=217090 RepID=A0A2N5NAN9_9BACL|nr:DUF5345 family protein [Paenibacillus pasadenensis]PLT47393.1 hypothetical protein B8V81_1617 [Paenibacillus pasadenensis]